MNDDIDAIIARGETRTTELNSRYEGLNFEDLSNFKSEASVQQWEGEDFRAGVRVSLFHWILLMLFRVTAEKLSSESSVVVKT